MKLSEPMIRMLRNLAAGRAATDALSGRSAFGGAEKTLHALVSRGLATKIPEPAATSSGLDWVREHPAR